MTKPQIIGFEERVAAADQVASKHFSNDLHGMMSSGPESAHFPLSGQSVKYSMDRKT